jgi:D-alanine-D-alanine ligase-like ATP-grasp enzyme
MLHQPKFAMRTFRGPSIFAPFASVVAQFTIPTAAEPPRGGTLPEVISARLCNALVAQLDWSAPFEMLVAGLARAVWRDLNDLPCRTDRMPLRLGRVCLGYYDERATSWALQLGYELALTAVGQDRDSIDPHSVLAKLDQMSALMERLQPGDVDRTMIRAARERAIPFYQVAADARVFQYGQGKYGRHFLATSSQFDSRIGSWLQHNKVISNSLIWRLGFPGVKHGVADTVANAVRLASRIGYPLVIKPIDARESQGVTADVTSEEEVSAAFAQADAISPGRVIVERFVEGQNVRLGVYHGQFEYADLRCPPRLVGDGVHTVVELIDAENQRRAKTATEGYPKPLKLDAAMLATLRKQSLRPNDCVPTGQGVKLRGALNATLGAIPINITDRVHVDNQRMAEAITRCFRLHTVGIDFVTADITKSWREVRCAVIEVNSAPVLGITANARAALLLERAFPGSSTGRVPSVLVVGKDAARAKEVVLILQRKGLTVGFVDRASMSLGGEPRTIEEVRLAERVQGLLLDPTCEALVVACTPRELFKDGLPLDHCNLCIIEPQVRLPGPLRGLLEQCSDLLTNKVSRLAEAHLLEGSPPLAS